MKCPACESEMRHRHIGDIEIDVCRRCNGVWLDATELDGVLGIGDDHSVEAVLDQTARRCEQCRYCGKSCPDSSICSDCDKPFELTCPHDGVAMYIVEAVGIELDRCPDCRGLWVDGFERKKLGQMRDELKEQAVAIEAAGATPPAGTDVAAALIGMTMAGGMAGDAEAGFAGAFGFGEAQQEPVPEDQNSDATSRADKPTSNSETPESTGEPTSMREYIEKHGNFEIMCSECSTVLSRYTAWEKEGVFFCIPCAEKAGHDGMSERSRSALYSSSYRKADYWHDEGHLVEVLQWFVGGIFRWKGKK